VCPKEIGKKGEKKGKLNQCGDVTTVRRKNGGKKKEVWGGEGGVLMWVRDKVTLRPLGEGGM